jgi:hypothetical protein
LLTHKTRSTQRIFDLEDWYTGCDEVLIDVTLPLGDTWLDRLVCCTRQEREGNAYMIPR